MKSIIFVFIVFVSMNLFAVTSQSPTSNQTTTADAKKVKSSQTDMSFEDLLVNGQYHFSDEAVTTVEENKVLNSLIGVRTDFKDRMKQSATLGEVK